MIRFGPAGIPLSCKGRTLKDGVEDVHALSLTALEVQMIRSRTVETYPDEEIVGLTMKTVPDRMIVEIVRDGEAINDPDEPIEEDDVLVCMVSGVTENFGELYDIRYLAKRVDVSLSLHTPYYMDLCSNNELTDSCMNSIRYSGVVANALGANVVVTNLGLYNPNMDFDEADDNIMDNVAALMDWWTESGLKPKLGIEITGKESIFGSLEQIIDLCDQIDGVIPVINWPNYYSRNGPRPGDENAQSWEVEDFRYAIEQAAEFNNGSVHSLFSGLEYRNWSETRLSPIKKGSLKFDTLADCLVDMKPDITIISSSPLLEHDAMYMRTLHERALSKNVGKKLRQKRKEEAEAASAAASGEPA